MEKFVTAVAIRITKVLADTRAIGKTGIRNLISGTAMTSAKGPTSSGTKAVSPTHFLEYKDDQEDGLQRAWRPNGKPYINYEAKDGHRYGMQKAALCYTLVDEKLKTEL